MTNPGFEGRTELKYAIPQSLRDMVLDLTAAHARPDRHAFDLASRLPELAGSTWSPRGYAVHSLYLDSPNLDGYGRRLAEARIRNRVRIRTYGDRGDDSPVFLECKRKLGPQVIKQRARVLGAERWIQGDQEQPWEAAVAAHPECRLAARWLEIVRAQRLRAVCSTHYFREVFVDGGARLTLDSRVRGAPAGDPRQLRRHGNVELLPVDWMVLELKFSGAEPAWMRSLLRELHLVSEPVSKFALGVVRTERGDRPSELGHLTPPSVRRDRPEWPGVVGPVDEPVAQIALAGVAR